MLLNYETVIVGERCVLVPYRPQHVPKYHSWMQDPNLLQATASEPLTLAEEREMQESWRDDPNKCTYIVLDRESCSFRRAASDDQEGDGHGYPRSTSLSPVNFDCEDDDDFVERNLHAMAGDVNLFLSQEEEDEGSSAAEEEDRVAGDAPEGGVARNAAETRIQAEIDIMIAEPSIRGRGLGREACALMIRYGAQRLNVRRFFCKINESNEASLRLFTSSLGFTQCGYAECFREVELELRFVSSTNPSATSGSSPAVDITESLLRTFTSRVARAVEPSTAGTTDNERK